ncbi:MAG: hypothetical protein ACE1Y4_14270 [Lysobacterales bacterium]
MPVQKTDKIWHNGKFIDWDDATIHITAHVISYGSLPSPVHALRRQADAPIPSAFR